MQVMKNETSKLLNRMKDLEFCFPHGRGGALCHSCTSSREEMSRMRRMRSCRTMAAEWGGGRALVCVCCQLLQLILGLKETAQATDKGGRNTSQAQLYRGFLASWWSVLMLFSEC